MIRVLAIGKKHELWVVPGIERYQQRLRRPFELEWELLPHSALQGDQARREESQRLLARIKADDFVVVLDERGELLSSPQVAAILQVPLEQSRRVVLVIGGAYGVDDLLRARVQGVWSLSPLVFPHQLVRLLVVEQLYRAQEIVAGRPYHHV